MAFAVEAPLEPAGEPFDEASVAQELAELPGKGTEILLHQASKTHRQR